MYVESRKLKQKIKPIIWTYYIANSITIEILKTLLLSTYEYRN